jgi:hypothetical protein
MQKLKLAKLVVKMSNKNKKRIRPASSISPTKSLGDTLSRDNKTFNLTASNFSIHLREEGSVESIAPNPKKVAKIISLKNIKLPPKMTIQNS